MVQYTKLNAAVTVANLNTLILMLEFQASLENPNFKLTQSMKKKKLQYQCNYPDSVTQPCNLLAVAVKVVGAPLRLPFCNNYCIIQLWKPEIRILNYFLYI